MLMRSEGLLSKENSWRVVGDIPVISGNTNMLITLKNARQTNTSSTNCTNWKNQGYSLQYLLNINKY
jgi:hypothetical protein